MEPPHADFGWTPFRSANADPRYSSMRRLDQGRAARRQLFDYLVAGAAQQNGLKP